MARRREGGRPKKEIKKEVFENLCSIQCTEAEICSVLDVTDKTLTRWCKDTYGASFSEIANKMREVGKASLRRKQFKMADRSERMLIWLGKQYLGQSDKMDTSVSVIDDDERKAVEDFLNDEGEGISSSQT